MLRNDLYDGEIKSIYKDLKQFSIEHLKKKKLSLNE
jgi:hypothetical protein